MKRSTFQAPMALASPPTAAVTALSIASCGRQEGRAGKAGQGRQGRPVRVDGIAGQQGKFVGRGSARSASATGAPRQLVQRQRKWRRGAAQSVACLVGPLGRQGGHQQHIILAEPTPGLQVAVA